MFCIGKYYVKSRWLLPKLDFGGGFDLLQTSTVVVERRIHLQTKIQKKKKVARLRVATSNYGGGRPKIEAPSLSCLLILETGNWFELGYRHNDAGFYNDFLNVSKVKKT